MLLLPLLLSRLAVSLAAVGSGTNSGLRTSSLPYSYSLTTFDPSGRLQQLEFAMRAVGKGFGAAAIVADDGVVVAKWSSGSLPKLHVCRVTEFIAMTYAGSEADFRFLASKCMSMAVEYQRDYGIDVTVASLADELSALVQEHTQVAGLRPFGCSVVLAGRDRHGLGLFKIDPTGWVAPWRATAIGKDSSNLEQKLAKALPQLHTVEDAVQLFRSIPRDEEEDDKPAQSSSADDADDDKAVSPRVHASLAVIRLNDDNDRGSVELFSDIEDYYSSSS